MYKAIYRILFSLELHVQLRLELHFFKRDNDRRQPLLLE